MMESIQRKAEQIQRLTFEEGLYLLREVPIMELARLASAEKERLYGSRVTYVMDTNPNYTNICECRCRFCAFFREEGAPGAYVLSMDILREKVGRAVEQGAATVLMQGGCNPGLPFEYYTEMIKTLRENFPAIHLHLFSPPEIITISRAGRLSIRETLETLKLGGLSTLPGGGAEILVDEVRRRISPRKCSAREWLEVMEEAHRLGFKSTATMVFGVGEDDHDILTHLEEIRDLQDRTHGFTAFIPWSFKHGGSELSQLVSPEPGTKYLRILAVARLYLDNFPHIQTSWFSQGKRTGQLGLLFGADDFGGTLFEENVLKAANFNVQSCLEEIREIIIGAGCTPEKRSTLYEIMEDHDE